MIYHRAVATLDEQEVYNTLYKVPVHDALGAAQKISKLPKEGGTIDPLPDGAVVKVERVEWADLGDSLDVNTANDPRLKGAGFTSAQVSDAQSRILAAYNAKQEN